MKTLKEIKDILLSHKDKLIKEYSVKEIKIFGSYVKKQQNEKSDIDILIDFHEVPDLLKFIEIERYLEKILDTKVDLVRKPVLRDELKNDVLKESVSVDI